MTAVIYARYSSDNQREDYGMYGLCRKERHYRGQTLH